MFHVILVVTVPGKGPYPRYTRPMEPSYAKPRIANGEALCAALCRIQQLYININIYVYIYIYELQRCIVSMTSDSRVAFCSHVLIWVISFSKKWTVTNLNFPTRFVFVHPLKLSPLKNPSPFEAPGELDPRSLECWETLWGFQLLTHLLEGLTFHHGSHGTHHVSQQTNWSTESWANPHKRCVFLYLKGKR